MHPEDRDRVVALSLERQARGATADVEYRVVRPDGSVRWVRDRAFPVKDSAGRFYRVAGIAEDVTDARKAEQALRESEERFRRLAAANIVGVGVSDGGGAWLEANDELLRIIGHDRDELRAGRLRWIDMTPEKYRPLEEERIAEARRRGACTPYEKEYVRGDGSPVPVLIGYAALEEGHDRFICFVLDLTPQKRVEAALKEADRRKDEFLAMLAHELRNPLAPVRNAVQVMKRLGPADPTFQRAGEMMERQVEHLARLVDDLLDVSRVTRGKIKLQKEAVDLAAVVARAVETSQPLVEARRHELTVALPPGPVWLEGDAARLAQIVGNLLNNAAKYTEDGGHIRLAVERRPGEAVLRVEDDGIGIPGDLLPHVFDLFTQGDRSPARVEGGLGIGLTLVKSLVEMHGGRVEARSEGPGKGQRSSSVRLPLAAAESSPTDGAGATERDGRAPALPLRVLVVDDNADAAEMLALFLRSEGHEVRSAHDGPAALRTAESFRPEVVVLDIGLPRMDGYEVARRLRERAGPRTPLLVALTGYGQEEDRRRAREAGFDAHLVKPADPEELQRLLARGPATRP